MTLVYLSFAAAVFLYHALKGLRPDLWATPLLRQFAFFAAYSAMSFFIFHYHNLYNSRVFTTTLRQMGLIAKSVLALAAGIAVLSFALKNSIVPASRLVIFFFIVISTASVALWRVFVVRPAYLRLKWLMNGRNKVLVIGSDSANNLCGSLPSSSVFKPCGFISIPPGAEGRPAPAELFDRVRGSVERLRPSALLVAYDGQSYEALFDMIEACRKLSLKVYVYSKLLNVIPEYVVVERYGDFTLVDISPEARTSLSEMMKSLLDRILSLASIIILSPLFIMLAAAVKFTSRGPVLYKQTRIGKRGRPFTFYKFRSMYAGSDRDGWRISSTIDSIRSGESAGGSTKVVNRAMVTPVGRFMRKTSLDELPQLFNVLRGEMSLVGPRPPLPYEWEHYSSWHRRRLTSTPGCTGLWQVTARSKVGFNDTVLLDLYYLYNRSLWMDMKILFQTFAVVAFAKGGE
ncbi:MAG: sugar transferase [Deltaproteobacteria bacterium]|nr:sugar transferase [Deltaproteobacteria bacterium]